MLLKIPKAYLQNLSKIKFYFSNFRITDWRAYLGLSLLPFLRKFPEIFINIALAKSFLINLTTMTCFLAFAFGINNCFDIETDIAEGNANKNPIAIGKISFKNALIVVLMIAVLGSTILAFYTLAWEVIFIYLLLLFLGGFYSAPPLRFKTRPFLDIISHGFFLGSLLYIYGCLIQGNDVMTAVRDPLVPLIFIYSIILNLRNHWEDYDFDLKANINTTATYLGYEKTQKAIIFLTQIHWVIMVTFCSIISFQIFVATLMLLFAANALLIFRLIKLEKWLRIVDMFTIVSYILLSLH